MPIRSMFRSPVRAADNLLWYEDLKPHATGDFSMASIQANPILEDQAQVLPTPAATFVGVYDGHGGHQAARFVNSCLLPHLFRLASEDGDLRWVELLRRAFHDTEEEYLSLVDRSWPMQPELLRAGTCCLVGVVTKSAIYLANLGDCRAVLGRRPEMNRSTAITEPLTVDHNVDDPQIRAEVTQYCPKEPDLLRMVNGAWRIKGKIQVSRSIGDVSLKKPQFSADKDLAKIAFLNRPPLSPLTQPVLTAVPSVVMHRRQNHDLFLIFASDGLWQFVTNQQAVEIVYKNPRKGIAKMLIKVALRVAAHRAGISSGDLEYVNRGARRPHHDDITVVVIYLDHQFMQDANNPSFETEAHNCTTTPADIYTYRTHGSAGPSSA